MATKWLERTWRVRVFTPADAVTVVGAQYYDRVCTSELLSKEGYTGQVHLHCRAL